MNITLLNTSILTNYGTFDYQPISLAQAKVLVKQSEVFSAIGHLETAEILTDLLEIEVAANRTNYIQKVGDTALVFKLKSRIPEGKVLNRAEIEEIGYEFGILLKLS